MVDGSIINDSPFLEKKVDVSSYAKLARLKDYGGWQDRYHYLLPDYTDNVKNIAERMHSVIDITKVTKFKVKEVRKKVYGVGHVSHQCIFEDLDTRSLTFICDCNRIDEINIVTEFLEEARRAFDISKQIGILKRKKINGDKETYIFSVNDSVLIALSSFKELILVLTDESVEYPVTYTYLNSQLPYVIENPDKLRESEIYKWQVSNNSYRDGLSKKDIILSNALPDSILLWIKSMEPNLMVNRWVLTQLFILNAQQTLDESKFRALREIYQGDKTSFDTLVRRAKNNKNMKVHIRQETLGNGNSINAPTVHIPSQTQIIEDLI